MSKQQEDQHQRSGSWNCFTGVPQANQVSNSNHTRTALWFHTMFLQLCRIQHIIYGGIRCDCYDMCFKYLSIPVWALFTSNSKTAICIVWRYWVRTNNNSGKARAFIWIHHSIWTMSIRILPACSQQCQGGESPQRRPCLEKAHAYCIPDRVSKSKYALHSSKN